MEGLATRRANGAEARCPWFAVLLLAACARSDERWIADLESADPFARGLAAIALAEQAPQRGAVAVPALLETIDRPGVGLREHAEQALARVAPFAPEFLVQQLLEDERMSRERRAALLAALPAGGERSVSAIVAALAGPEHSSAADLGDVLVRIGSPSVQPLAELFSASDRDDLRDYLAWLLGRLGARARPAAPVLRSALQDAAPELRAAITEALERIEGTR